MNKERVGILHPGAMGVSIAASEKNTGYTVYWASEGRSPQTHERANRVSLLDIQSVAKLCDECSIIFSVCPPHAAAAEVYRRIAGFKDAQEAPPLDDVLKALLDDE